MTDPKLELVRFFDATPDEVFEAWSDPSAMAQWFVVDPTWHADVRCDFRVGGDFELTMHSPGGDVHTMTGVYREIRAPTLLVFTWNSHLARDSVVTIELLPAGEGCELRLTHAFLPSAHAREQHGHGWNGCLESLARHLSSTGTT